MRELKESMEKMEIYSQDLNEILESKEQSLMELKEKMTQLEANSSTSLSLDNGSVEVLVSNY